MKRIHRIGQAAPLTGKVSIKHLVPYGSVDAAIRLVHGDKQRLADMVVDGEGLQEPGENQWKRTGRIVDGALALAESGNFPEMPIFASATGEDAQVNMPFTVVPNVVTRGREPPEESALGKRRRERKEEVNPYDIAGEEEQPATEAERAEFQLFRMRRTRALGTDGAQGTGSSTAHATVAPPSEMARVRAFARSLGIQMGSARALVPEGVSPAFGEL